MKKLLDILHLDKRLTKLFYSVEMPLLPILAFMEFNGIGFVGQIYDETRTFVENKLQELKEHAYQLAGKPFSFDHTEQIAKILFEDLQLPYPAPIHVPPSETPKKGRKKQMYSTSATILEQLVSVHKLPALILQYRKLTYALK